MLENSVTTIWCYCVFSEISNISVFQTTFTRSKMKCILKVYALKLNDCNFGVTVCFQRNVMFQYLKLQLHIKNTLHFSSVCLKIQLLQFGATVCFQRLVIFQYFKQHLHVPK
jgi:hypothetical protein